MVIFSTGGTQIKRTTKSENLILIIFVLVAVYTLILGYIYPWGGWGGEFGRPELINSLLGNSKIFLAVVISYFFINRGFSFITFLLFSCLLIITFVEGSRTTLSTLIIAMLIITAGNGLITIRRLLFLVAISLSAFITIIFIALSRIGISLNDLSLFEALYPLYIEGMYGSYMCLQIYDLVWVKEVMSPTWGVHLVMDPFLFLIPRALLSLFGIDKDSLTIYSDWSTRASSFLDDPLAPYGGFYFIADAFVAFTFLGPLLIGGLFGFITGYIEKYGTRSFKGKYVYILYLIGFFMVFIKHEISQSIHFLIVTAIAGFIVYFVAGSKSRSAIN